MCLFSLNRSVKTEQAIFDWLYFLQCFNEFNIKFDTCSIRHTKQTSQLVKRTIWNVIRFQTKIKLYFVHCRPLHPSSIVIVVFVFTRFIVRPCHHSIGIAMNFAWFRWERLYVHGWFFGIPGGTRQIFSEFRGHFWTLLESNENLKAKRSTNIDLKLWKYQYSHYRGPFERIGSKVPFWCLQYKSAFFVGVSEVTLKVIQWYYAMLYRLAKIG